MDNRSRIATKREGYNFGDTKPDTLYNLEDHLGSSLVLLDDVGSDVNYEEYFPFGETSFGSYAKKRYRYTGKERDAESGLYYYGARYYVPWLCRFISCDPKAAQFPNQSSYNYCFNNPLNLVDKDGMAPGGPDDPPKSESTEPAVHTVEKGQTLSGIAKQHNTTVEKLREANNLDPRNDRKLQIGTKLEIPGSTSSSEKKSFSPMKLEFSVNQTDALTVAPKTSGANIPEINDWYGPGGKANALFGTFSSFVQETGGSFRLRSGLNSGNTFSPKFYQSGWTGGSRAKITTYNVSKVGGALGKLSFGIGIAMDIRGMMIYKDNPLDPNAVHPGKAALNTGMGAYGLWVNPVAGALYFGMDAFHPGGWQGFMENNAKLQQEYDKIDPPKAGKPHFKILPWGAQKL